MTNTGTALSSGAALASCNGEELISPDQVRDRSGRSHPPGSRAGRHWRRTAEYVALTQLQADAFITLDGELSRAVQKLVTVAPIHALS